MTKKFYVRDNQTINYVEVEIRDLYPDTETHINEVKIRLSSLYNTHIDNVWTEDEYFAAGMGYQPVTSLPTRCHIHDKSDDDCWICEPDFQLISETLFSGRCEILGQEPQLILETRLTRILRDYGQGISIGELNALIHLMPNQTLVLTISPSVTLKIKRRA